MSLSTTLGGETFTNTDTKNNETQKQNKTKEYGENDETENNLKEKVEGLETTQKSEGKQENKNEKILTTETPVKIEGTEMPENMKTNQKKIEKVVKSWKANKTTKKDK